MNDTHGVKGIVLLAVFLLTFVALLTGCTNCLMIDLVNDDVFSYNYAPWENRRGEEMAARARYYERVCRTQYRKGTRHRVEIAVYAEGEDCSQTDALKKVSYRVEGEKEAE